MTYKISVEQDESGYFVAEVPGMPGCYSQGRTVEEAMSNIKEAMCGWVEVMNEKPLKKGGTQVFEVSL
ncbi:MAG: type II toxin-antitoxin system HicB family antitoxin [Spirochaetota bacterium]|nr:type II toxin-antitoxin system HicB family antitoxin [Spirochaetota bacterium]